MAITEGGSIPIIRTIPTIRTILTTRPTRVIPMVRTIAVFLDTAPFLMRPTRLRLDQIGIPKGALHRPRPALT
jgi:hypothetical protein